MLIRLAREYRRVVSYDEVPPVLRHAIPGSRTSTSSSTPASTTASCLECCRRRAGGALSGRVRRNRRARGWFGCGSGPTEGSTLTQQLVRSYFLHNLTSREGADVLVRRGLAPRLLSTVLGVLGTNKLLRKLEEVRLALWLEDEMRWRYGSTERAPSARSSHATPGSSTWGNGPRGYGFAAGSEYYFGKPSRATGLRTLTWRHCWPGS